MPDPINHPAYYERLSMESIELMEEAEGIEAVKHFCICNCWKYLCRHGHKGNDAEDMRKLAWYAQRYADILDRENNSGDDDGNDDDHRDYSNVFEVVPGDPINFKFEPHDNFKRGTTGDINELFNLLFDKNGINELHNLLFDKSDSEDSKQSDSTDDDPIDDPFNPVDEVLLNRILSEEL